VQAIEGGRDGYLSVNYGQAPGHECAEPPAVMLLREPASPVA